MQTVEAQNGNFCAQVISMYVQTKQLTYKKIAKQEKIVAELKNVVRSY